MSGPISGSTSVGKRCFPGSIAIHASSRPISLFDNGPYSTSAAKRFVLIYAGPGHSASDMMMMVEPDRVLFAGDIVQNSRIPFMNGDDVDTANWSRALADVETLDPKFIIPGHGRPSTAAKQAIAFTRDYINYVRGAMGKAVASWTDFDVAYAQTDWSNTRNPRL